MKQMNKLGEFLKTRREALGLTQRSLAQKLGVEASHVAFIESGRRKPSLKLEHFWLCGTCSKTLFLEKTQEGIRLEFKAENSRSFIHAQAS